MSYEDIECPSCHRVGQNIIETNLPVTGHPNVECSWLICKCGKDLFEVEE